MNRSRVALGFLMFGYAMSLWAIGHAEDRLNRRPVDSTALDVLPGDEALELPIGRSDAPFTYFGAADRWSTSGEDAFLSLDPLTSTEDDDAAAEFALDAELEALDRAARSAAIETPAPRAEPLDVGEQEMLTATAEADAPAAVVFDDLPDWPVEDEALAVDAPLATPTVPACPLVGDDSLEFESPRTETQQDEPSCPHLRGSIRRGLAWGLDYSAPSFIDPPVLGRGKYRDIALDLFEEQLTYPYGPEVDHLPRQAQRTPAPLDALADDASMWDCPLAEVAPSLVAGPEQIREPTALMAWQELWNSMETFLAEARAVALPKLPETVAPTLVERLADTTWAEGNDLVAWMNLENDGLIRTARIEPYAEIRRWVASFEPQVRAAVTVSRAWLHQPARAAMAELDETLPGRSFTSGVSVEINAELDLD